ncbi:hypothetical protein Tco_0766752, partial [Tanacetum coccineum]
MTGGLLRGTPMDTIGATPAEITERTGGSTSGGEPIENIETPIIETTPSAKEQIEGYLSALKSIVKEYNGRGNVSLIRLSFDDVEDRTRDRTVVTGKEIRDADLKRPFKEAAKTPLTQRIIEFAGPEFKMPANIKLYNGTMDPEDHLSRFSSASNSGSIDGWVELRQQFTTIFSTKRACFKDPTEITKIVRKANETLVAFKERWIIKISFIMGVPEVMKISSFTDAHKCPKLAKRYSDKVPRTMDEMMTRVDDFVRSEEAFASTELPKGEASEALKKSSGLVSRREDRFHRGGYGADRQRNEGRSAFNIKEGLVPYCTQAPYQAPRDQGYHHPRLKRQLEISLESGKLNHLIKDVRQRGRGNAKGRDAGKDKVINMIRSWPDEKKRKSGSIAGGDVRALLREL